jgi:Cell wall-associated hydrolases (invasion-associated proteins)
MNTRRVAYLLFILLIFTSCGSLRQGGKKRQGEVDDLIKYARKYEGVKYRSGGTTPKGFDCSGYSQYVYKEFGYNLPRTTTDQSKIGKKVNRRDVLPGDLVFFKGRDKKKKRVGHVGIVTEVDRHGDFTFIHASSSRGIVETSIKELYYKDRYLSARRIILYK